MENAATAQKVFDNENMLRLQRRRDSLYLAKLEAREMAKRVESGNRDPEDLEIGPKEIRAILKARNDAKKKA